jgi:predicted kinase
MRKWMRERMKRRKKTEPAEKTQAAPQEAPLQPAYFDAQERPSEPAESAATDAAPVQMEEPAVTEAELPAATSAESESPRAAQNASSEGPRRRRRRGRGGRGRGQSSRKTPAAPLQPTLVAQPAASEPASQAMPSAPATPTAPHSSKGVVVLAIGLPGSGKSSWFKRHNIRALSSDLLRDLLFDDPTEQRYQDLVFSNLRSMLKARMIARRPLNYVDATNLSPHDRHTWIKLARDYGYDVHAVFFDVPLEVCMERNQRRQRVVPEEAMRRMAAKFRPPAFEEGFSKITVVRVKKKEAAS